MNAPAVLIVPPQTVVLRPVLISDPHEHAFVQHRWNRRVRAYWKGELR